MSNVGLTTLNTDPRWQISLQPARQQSAAEREQAGAQPGNAPHLPFCVKFARLMELGLVVCVGHALPRRHEMLWNSRS
jgi:hypothetical protein